MRIISNIVFVGTADFGIPTLEKLIDCKSHTIQVVTQPDRPRGRGKKILPSPVKKIAVNRRISIYQPENINDKEFINILDSLNPDIILVVAYGQILSDKVLQIPRRGCINIHGSLLPAYRGAAPINWALINGEKETGITYISMNSKIDDGNIIGQFKINILPDETFGELSNKLAVLSAETILKILHDFINGEILQIPQNRKIATYTRKMKKNDGEINWSNKAAIVYNLIRGTIPYPGAYTYYQGKKIKITQSRKLMEDEGDNSFKAFSPGTIVNIEKDGLTVTTGDEGKIKLVQLIPAGAKEMTAWQFVNGYKIKTSDKFGK